jgi:hypothetical protein
METLNGRIKKVMGRNKIKALDMGRRNTRHSHWRFLWIALTLFLSGCVGLKKAALIAGASSMGAGVGSLLSGSVGAVAGAATGATAGVIATGIGGSEKSTNQPLEITGDAPVTIVQEASPNFFSLLQQLVEIGGWLLVLVLIVPMVLGWILPGPLEGKKRKKKK